VRFPRRKRRPDPALAPQPGAPLDVDVAPADFGTLVAVAGELDIAMAPALRSALSSREVVQSAAVVVDLSRVTFMDSTAISVFLTLERDLGAHGGRLAIAVPEGAVRLLFDVTGLDEHLPLYSSREAAEAAVVL
jgi:anti-sigma B factor antagonist